jgi:hypothetical protein
LHTVRAVVVKPLTISRKRQWRALAPHPTATN